MNDTVMDVLDFGFDLLCAAIGFLCLLKCISFMTSWITIFQQIYGG